MIEPFYFDPKVYGELAAARRDEFLTAKPFRHVVMDNFLPERVVDAVIEEFPNPGDVPWKEFKQKQSVKLASEGDEFFGPATRQLMSAFNSQTFLQFLETLTGISDLMPDPYFEGGGLHQIERGGFLKVHADFNKYERFNLDRRLNAIVYLNKDWQEAWGGALELWDWEMTGAQARVLPLYNRCVIFATTDTSFHGHPDPLQCPPDRRRRSLALYYYTNGRPIEEESTAHSTLYQARPGERVKEHLVEKVARRIRRDWLSKLSRN
jgi:Rps23 Pro-64 3,4-dihydroxylase Tpa1-like proline 4-hydroxylase